MMVHGTITKRNDFDCDCAFTEKISKIKIECQTIGVWKVLFAFIYNFVFLQFYISEFLCNSFDGGIVSILVRFACVNRP